MNSNVAQMGQVQAPRITTKVELITPERARIMRDTAHFERQRNLSPGNVDRLAKEMAAGRFTQGTQIFLCVLPGGRDRIINGNHTLEAIHKSGKPQLLTITRVEVENMDEAGRMYAVFDLQKVRSWGDSLRGTGLGEGIPQAVAVVAALGIIQVGFKAGGISAGSRIERLDMLDDYRYAAELWGDAVTGATKQNVSFLKRASVLAVALETLRFQPHAAHAFWHRVAQDNGLTAGMPERALLNWLRANKISGETDRHEHVKAAALAWNAFFKGATPGWIKPRSMTSFYLLGTPWVPGKAV
jgi:hypothetical protein